MANLLTRIKNTVMADIYETLEKKEQKNPIALLNQYLRECEAETEKVRKLLERQHQLKDQFTSEFQQASQMADKRAQQAEIAQKAGEIELATFATQEQTQFAERAIRLKEALENATKQQVELEHKYEEMKHKLKDMHIRRLEMMGRENVSRAHHQMDQVMENNLYNDKSYSRFSEIESYLDRLEQQVNSSYYRNTIDGRIAQLEKEMKKQESHSIS
ncbi:PspA/IM30 family protein [Mesobacillus maritimus]|uniref:PspA/IM30 family protein n=1 Tax=Mesobacillus maritimus TaxID=1643336 RepID=UPI002040F586|nr:PspA/IM30 family protein [Mesobacillus maritimus]MCM3585515.1 PspA/IM30 family protein [Mesobacillus maritimus]MCM3669775.1 PspA/IM30 family protein [Mesobacillus maritimus]